MKPRDGKGRPLDEQTILVTGSTDGLGRALARELASVGATVLLHGRNEARLKDAVDKVRRATGNDRLRPYLADLSSLEEVRRLAREVGRDTDRLDVLVNNAGIGKRPIAGAARGERERWSTSPSAIR